MSKRPVLPLWGGDLLADTPGLSEGEFGCYMLLLLAAWYDRTGSLPNEDRTLRQIARSVDHRMWQRRRVAVLERFFDLGADGRWRQKRLTREIEKAKVLSEKRRLSAEARWSAQPVDNPVDNSVDEIRPAVLLRSSAPKNTKPNEINGRPMQLHPNLNLKRDSALTVTSPRGSANGQQKQESKINLGKTTEAARQRQASNAARAAWEADLAKRLGPEEFATALERLAKNPGLCDPATIAEQRKAGAGSQAVALGLLKKRPP
jgi:uncharacterized protein YdaU (DUF1376 family)